jgi:hypothetical protein
VKDLYNAYSKSFTAKGRRFKACPDEGRDDRSIYKRRCEKEALTYLSGGPAGYLVIPAGAVLTSYNRI